MQTFVENLVIIYLFTYIFEPSFVSSSNIPISLHLWSWECINEKCTPVKKTKLEEVMQSLETCNMLCSNIPIWPLPTGTVNIGKKAVTVHPQSFNVEIITAPSDTVRQYINDAFILFKNNLRYMKSGLGGESYVAVKVSVLGSKDPRMRLDTDESYQLLIGPATPVMSSLIVNINALSFCGARHGLETLSQLIWLDQYMDSLYMIQEAKIVDSPRYPYRGLMVDTARHFIPLSELMRTVDAMAAAKMNTLHWHATDSQAFSLQLSCVPALAQYGAYGPNDFYTIKEIEALARHARLRGVRLLIEIDTPAHINNAWSNLHSDFILEQCSDSDTRKTYCEDPPCGQLNPFNPFIFEILQNIYSEIVDLTGVDDIFHLGGNDVSEACWAVENSESNPMSLWLDYTRSIIHRIELIKGKMPNITLLWSSRLCERINTDLKDLNTIITFQILNESWSQNLGGVNTLISHENAWDLNSGNGMWYDSNDKRPYNSWQRFYEYRPWVRSDLKIGGGEATLWSWNVDEGNIHERIWPRAAALAERLWSDRHEGASKDVHTRLDLHRTRMAARGLHCAPIWSNWCTQHPYTCT